MGKTDWKKLWERWKFPCTLVVLLYLLYTVTLCVLFWDSGRASSPFLPRLFGSRMDQVAFLLVDMVVGFLVIILFPSGMILWEPENTFLPKRPAAKRRAVLLGYVVLLLVIAYVVIQVALNPPPYPLWLYSLPRVVACLVYLYFCGVANYPFQEEEHAAP